MKKKKKKVSVFAESDRTDLQQSPRQKAFTLAEVLITLVIIGVIGALTVPSLIQNTQKQEYVSALKKAYSTLSQAARLIIAEEGSPKGNGSWVTNADDIYNLFKKNLNSAKECAGSRGCFGQSFKYLNGNSAGSWDANDKMRKLVLADGMQIMFGAFVSNQCDINNSDNNGSNEVCIKIHVDLNGEKEPNIWGRDVFQFVMKEKGLYPAGCDIDGYCNKNDTGYACACKVLREGAMNY